ncbi:cyclic lactone autoinducer peptide [Clostridium sp. CM028]|nr:MULTISPECIES: cyclic lactone autoinducer peptide [Clostridium]MBU3092396.1 cyclic lactone autoinducer peptide [Clostridium sp. CF011]MBW9146025.1 cyclic lactone autoinducer peptide [Clostridium sp. CM027]MBW9149891.1 cyclic lactone autoinducer peptide [Clostridium sp. CM028]MBZ9606690.1 cyclic lactone autoinducer peptide [Clostridium estertheticum]UVE39495.1 cyclic lactone autoinducer peptide [Clostridium sp. CM027]
MKNLILEKVASITCSGVSAVAKASSSMCIVWSFNECKMPKSLYKVDKKL